MPLAQLTPTDQTLYLLINDATPATIADVIALMESIDTLLPANDGLKWFNRLYLMVTQQVDLNPPAACSRARSGSRVSMLSSPISFSAVADYLSGHTLPSSWSALFEARQRPVDRIRFALAGMNAHINHDLALALIATNTELNLDPTPTSLEFADYNSVNALLNTVMPSALTMLATDTLGVLAQDTGKIGRLLAFWDMCRARDLAWEFGDHLRDLSGIRYVSALAAQDALTGVIGRAILAAA